jgi:ribosomal protein S18 acetylase RimI-like enzyme
VQIVVADRPLPPLPQFRLAGPADAQAVATLHAESWRRHYRGLYSDAYLDGDVAADRLLVWRERLAEPDPFRCTLLAEDGDELVGFAHTVFEDDPTWGALLDNLHVAASRKRSGIGSSLLALTAKAVIRRRVWTGLYLWCAEQNTDAQAFYQARGGTFVGSRRSSPPGGVPGRLIGSPFALRYAWPEPAVLLARR